MGVYQIIIEEKEAEIARLREELENNKRWLNQRRKEAWSLKDRLTNLEAGVDKEIRRLDYAIECNTVAKGSTIIDWIKLADEVKDNLKAIREGQK